MVGSLNHVTLSVTELERSFRFYSQVLEFRPLARWVRGAYLLAGGQTWLCLSLDERTRTEPSAEVFTPRIHDNAGQLSRDGRKDPPKRRRQLARQLQ
jgi:catechol 2,3-dioxygenase-like lactoylglutathione lyase family enzyme